MNITIRTSDLVSAVSTASRFVATRAQIPVLSNVVLKTLGAKLQVKATNLEMSVLTQIGAKVSRKGEIALPAREFLAIISNLDSETLDIAVSKERVKITSDLYEGTIMGVNTSDFPEVQLAIGKKPIEMSLSEFRQVLSRVLYSVSQDDTRPILTGVNVVFGVSSIIFYSTDGFRMSKYSLPLKKTAKRDTNIIIPKGVLTEILKGGEAETLRISSDSADNSITFSIGESLISSRVIAGEYPDAERIIPKNTRTKFSVSKSELLRLIKLAAVYAKDSSNVVVFSVGKDKLEVIAKSSTLGEQKGTLETKVKGPKNEIHFNYRFIEEFIGSISGESIQIEMIDSASPTVFRDPEDKNYLHLIMPVKG